MTFGDNNSSSAEQQAGNVSSMQSSGPCVYKDKCKVPGKTLYVCRKCKCRFHHLCSGSDDPNLCREGCNGVPPDRDQRASGAKPAPMNVFGPETEGVDLTGMQDSEEDDHVLRKANQELSKPKATPATTPHKRFPTRSQQLPVLGTKLRSTSKKPEATDADKGRPSTDSPRPKTSGDKGQAKGSAGSTQAQATSKGPEARQAMTSPASPLDQSDSSSSSSSEEPRRPTVGGKVPRKVPRNYVPALLPGGRPTVNPRLPNHRMMVLPLYREEPVVYEDPDTGRPRLGIVKVDVHKPQDPISVRDLENGRVVEGLTMKNFVVVKETDYLIYVGARCCIRNP